MSGLVLPSSQASTSQAAKGISLPTGKSVNGPGAGVALDPALLDDLGKGKGVAGAAASASASAAAAVAAAAAAEATAVIPGVHGIVPTLQ